MKERYRGWSPSSRRVFLDRMERKYKQRAIMRDLGETHPRLFHKHNE